MPRQWSTVGMTVRLGASNLLLLAVLLVFVWLKEDRMFWLNAGGWPIWLRELVLITFYPLLFLEMCILPGFASLYMTWRRESRDLARAGFVSVLCFSMVFLLIVGLLVQDNFKNLMEGKPLHSQERL